MTVTCFPAQCVNPICHFQKNFKSKHCIVCGWQAKQLSSASCSPWEEHSGPVQPETAKDDSGRARFSFIPLNFSHGVHTCRFFLLMNTVSWYAWGKPLPSSIPPNNCTSPALCVLGSAVFKKAAKSWSQGIRLKEIKRDFYMCLNPVRHICIDVCPRE